MGGAECTEDWRADAWFKPVCSADSPRKLLFMWRNNGRTGSILFLCKRPFRRSGGGVSVGWLAAQSLVLTLCLLFYTPKHEGRKKNNERSRGKSMTGLVSNEFNCQISVRYIIVHVSHTVELNWRLFLWSWWWKKQEGVSHLYFLLPLTGVTR